MNPNDIRFKKTAQNIGIILLIFISLYSFAFGQIYVSFSMFINFFIQNEIIANIITELVSGILYLAMFMIPAIVYIPLSKSTCFTTNVNIRPRLNFKIAVPIVLASIGIITSAAYLNSMMCSFFEVPNELISVDEHISFANFIVYTLTLAVIPAICEEFLFRKTILGALSPYGEDFAIVASAVMFGLMHQNILQIFYTTMAGLVIGYAYTRTRSFLCVFLIHFVNNFISVIEQSVYANLREPTASIVGGALITGISVLAIISIIALIFIEKTTPSIYSKGSFGNIELPSLSHRRVELSGNRTRMFYLSPTVLIFTIISVILCILTLLI